MLIIAVIAASLMLYVPGWLIWRAVSGTASDECLETQYERVVVSVLLSGWLALVLAEFGLFVLWLHLGLLVLASGMCVVWLRRQKDVGCRSGDDSGSARHRHRRVSGWRAGLLQVIRGNAENIAFACVGLVALLLVIRPFETILGARDAGVYANTGFAVARTGGLVQYDALLAEIGQAAQSDTEEVREPARQAMSNLLGVQNPHRYIATRMRATGFFINEGEAAAGRVVPQFLHLFPAWIGLMTGAFGLYGGLFTPGLMGVLGAWSVGMLGRRLAGSWVGLLAFLFLALNTVQVWFGRYSTSETTAQFLIFAGLYCFAKWQHVNNRRQQVFLAALAGVAFGQLALTRIDFFLVIGPVVIYLLYCWLTHRWQDGQTALAIGLGAMLLHASLHIVFIARAYFFDTGFERLQDYALTAYLALPFVTDTLRDSYISARVLTDPMRVWRELALLGGCVAILLVLRHWLLPLRWFETLLRRWQHLLLGGMAAGIILLAAYAYLVRPQIIDFDVLFNTRQGWNDPLTRDPRFVQADVNEWRMSIDEARAQAGVVLVGDPEYAATAIDYQATEQLRAQLWAERGPWRGPFSNQTFNWMRLQGYVGAPIALPRVFYDDGKEWWREYAEQVPPGVQPPTGLPVREKDIIPLANFVRVGWYLSPLGVVSGVAGFALWWWRGMGRTTWLLFVIGLVGTFFFVRQTYGTSDQTYIYILRRFVPVTYPVFSLGIAYAIVALAKWPGSKEAQPGKKGSGRWAMIRGAGSVVFAGILTVAMLAFFIWTGKTIYRHVEYAGAVEQIRALSKQFDADDVILLRGGAPTYTLARDIPDIVVTPLRFAFGLDALTVKGSQPGAYANLLADQVRQWQAQGRDIYLMLSANGGDFVLPGFDLQPVSDFVLTVPEFEQLTNQKPHNIATLTLPFAVYQLTEGQPGRLSSLAGPLGATDFAAQVQGFYLPEADQAVATTTSASDAYAWTNGDALIRLPWDEHEPPRHIELRAAGGNRPSHLGPARVCLSLLPENEPWPVTTGEFTPLECLRLDSEMATYRIPLDLQQPATTDSMLLHLASEAWVPAEADPRQNDRRSVGIQFGELTISTFGVWR